MDSSADFVCDVINAVCERHGTDISAMPPTVRDFMFAQYFKACIDNGGFYGFIINPSGDEALATVDAIAALGASRSKALLERVIRSFPDSNYPSSVFEREAVLDSVDVDSWDSADDEFYEDADQFDDLLVKWIMSNPNAFPTTRLDGTG
jgi:hypothetical protein